MYTYHLYSLMNFHKWSHRCIMQVSNRNISRVPQPSCAPSQGRPPAKVTSIWTSNVDYFHLL